MPEKRLESLSLLICKMEMEKCFTESLGELVELMCVLSSAPSPSLGTCTRVGSYLPLPCFLRTFQGAAEGRRCRLSLLQDAPAHQLKLPGVQRQRAPLKCRGQSPAEGLRLPWGPESKLPNTFGVCSMGLFDVQENRKTAVKDSEGTRGRESL